MYHNMENGDKVVVVGFVPGYLMNGKLTFVIHYFTSTIYSFHLTRICLVLHYSHDSVL